MLNLESSRTLFVFSHPNHEVALLALAGRLRPKVIILTDGGAQRRCHETRSGLKALELLGSACFFDYSEDAFYRALLAKDIGFFRSLGQRLKACSMDANPDQVLCDAIEFATQSLGGDQARRVILAAIDPQARAESLKPQR